MSGRMWITGPLVDSAVAWCWVPLALVGLAVSDTSDSLTWVLGGVFLLSFLHQPLTLPLVYADPEQRRSRPALFAFSPVVFLVAVTAGLWISITLVAIVAGLWNAEHTLMQRYGVTRIYGRKGGDDAGRIEKPMYLSWLVLALVWVAADAQTETRIAGLPLGEVNINSLQVLAEMRPWARLLLVPTLATVAVLLVMWVGGEVASVRAGIGNPAKYVYVAATAALFAWVLFVDPLSGLIGYVGAHSIEYFVIVHRSLGSRYNDGSGGPLGAWVRRPGGRRRFLLTYLAAFAVLFGVVRGFGTPTEYTFIVLMLGGLHVFYDGFIWKLRKPQVARAFA